MNWLLEIVQQYIPTWLEWLTKIIWLFFFSSYLLLIIYTFTILTSIVMSPLSGFLSSEVEQYQANKPLIKSSTYFEQIKDIPRIFARELKKLWYYIPRVILILLLYLIPFLQILAPLIAAIFSAWMMAVQVIDYPMDNHKVGFDDMLEQLKTRKLLITSFGASVLLCALVPIVNFFVIPASVVGATLIWIDHYRLVNLPASN